MSPQYLHSPQILSKAKQSLNLTTGANTHVIRDPHWSENQDTPPYAGPDWLTRLSV